MGRHMPSKRRKVTLEDIIEFAKTCKSVQEFRTKDPSYAALVRQNDWVDKVYSYLPPNDYVHTKETCRLAAEKYDNIQDFKLHDFYRHKKATEQEWVDEICSHMPTSSLTRNITYEFCQEEIKKYSSRSELHKKDSGLYVGMKNKGWFDELTASMAYKENPNTYWSRSRFIEVSEGEATFYILHCMDGEESFYKFGITCRSIEIRYKTPYYMPYSYGVQLEVTTTPEIVWDLERNYKKMIKKYKYDPDIYFAGCTECFKCNKNNTLLGETT